MEFFLEIKKPGIMPGYKNGGEKHHLVKDDE